MADKQTLQRQDTNHFHTLIYFLSSIDDQQAKVMQVLTEGQSARLSLPKDGTQLARLIPLLKACLLSQKKVIVLTPTKQQLERFNSMLTAHNLNQLSFSVQAMNVMQQQLQMRLTAAQPAERTPWKDNWKKLKKSSQRLADRLSDQYRHLLQPILGQHHRQNLIAAYLSAHHIQSKSALAGLIPKQNFSFSLQNFSKLSTDIGRAQQLYANQLDHPLGQLNDRFFLGEVTENDALQTTLLEMLQRGKQLRQQFLTQIDQYQNELQHYYDQHYTSAVTLLRTLIYQIEDFESANQTTLGKAGGLATKKSFFKILNGKNTTQEVRTKIIATYSQLKQLHDEAGELDFVLPPADDLYQPSPLLHQYQMALVDWHQGVPQVIREQLIRLNHKTVHPATQHSMAIEALESQLDSFVQQINKAAIFQHSLDNNSLTILQQQQLLDQIIGQLEQCLQKLGEFKEFSKWQRHWLQCDTATQEILLQLVRVGATDWLNIFETWFWYHCLLHHSARDLPQDDTGLRQLFAQSKNLEQYLAVYIRQQQQENWPASKIVLEQIQRTESASLASTLKTIQQYFPILGCTEDQLDTVLTTGTQADVLFVLDADFIQEKTIRPLAKQHLLISDTSAKDYPQKDYPKSLWENPGLGKLPYLTMDTTTEQIPPVLRFYLANQFGHLVYQESQTASVAIFPVMGRMDAGDQINEAEARQIIQHLHQLQGQEDGHPIHDLTIICMTIAQQRRIQHYIQESIRRQVAGADWLGVLKEKGLQVIPITEMKGRQFPRIILSLVVDGQNSLSNQQFWEQFPPSCIRSLWSMTTEQLSIFHSVPEETRKSWLQAESGLLRQVGHWLGYLRATSKSIGSQQKQILQAVASSQQYRKPSIPLIYRAIGQSLLAYFPVDRVKLGHRVGGSYFPITVWPEATNEVGVVILADYVLSDTDPYPWMNASRLKGTAHQLGFKVIETWSVLWWKHPEQTARQLAGKIMREAQLQR